MYEEYFKMQRDNARLKNKIRFIKKHKENLTFKQKVKYLIKYSPSMNLLMDGMEMTERFHEGLNIHSPSETYYAAAQKGMEDARKELGW